MSMRLMCAPGREGQYKYMSVYGDAMKGKRPSGDF